MKYRGIDTKTPYSFSRWTDVSGDRSKWAWFKACLDAGKMVAFDPWVAAPGVWSLTPQDTFSLVFWTKNPKNLIEAQKCLNPYQVIIHMTATGWEEAEKKSPCLLESGNLMLEVSKAFEKIYWRFSPIPLLPQAELFVRFYKLLEYAFRARITCVFVSFLQPNDHIIEIRTLQERFDILNLLADTAMGFGVKVILCADDRSFTTWPKALFETGICVPPSDFKETTVKEGCGCALMVDPFTINESCEYQCAYCYAGDRSLSLQRRNTTLLV